MSYFERVKNGKRKEEQRKSNACLQRCYEYAVVIEYALPMFCIFLGYIQSKDLQVKPNNSDKLLQIKKSR